MNAWDALIDAGTPYGIVPAGIWALDIARIEAGLIMLDVDYFSSHHAVIEDQKSTPYEINLGWTVSENKARQFDVFWLRRRRAHRNGEIRDLVRLMTKLLVDSCVLIDCFQADSPNRADSIAFVDHIVRANQLMTMPAHGWFEVWCNLNRLSDNERKYLHPVFAGQMQLPLELIHIDEAFILRYRNVRMPYTKAADHIFIVVAYVNKYPLVTNDRKMYSVCKELRINVSTPAEYLKRSA